MDVEQRCFLLHSCGFTVQSVLLGFCFYISTRNKIGCCDVGDLGGLPIKTPLSLMPTLTEGDVTIN